MKFSRLFLCAATLSFHLGCSTGYTKFRATNPRGELIAEWIGRGQFYPVSGGYRIDAIERRSGPPYMHISRYPHGRKATVTGAHIERWRTAEPEWFDPALPTDDDPAASHPPRPVSRD